MLIELPEQFAVSLETEFLQTEHFVHQQLEPLILPAQATTFNVHTKVTQNESSPKWSEEKGGTKQIRQNLHNYHPSIS